MLLDNIIVGVLLVVLVVPLVFRIIRILMRWDLLRSYKDGTDEDLKIQGSEKFKSVKLVSDTEDASI